MNTKITATTGRLQVKRDTKEAWQKASSNVAEIKPGELVGIYEFGENTNSNTQSRVAFSTNSDDTNIIYVTCEGGNLELGDNNTFFISGQGEINISFENKTNKKAYIKCQSKDLFIDLEPQATNELNITFDANAATKLEFIAYSEDERYASISLKMGYNNNFGTKQSGKEYKETPYVSNLKAGEGYGAVAQAGLGGENEALGAFSAAFGHNTEANGFASFTSGEGTKTSNDYEVAFGKFNLSKENTTVFSIGEGLSDSQRANLVEITKEGNLKIKGSLYLENDDDYPLNKDKLQELIENSGGGILFIPFEVVEYPTVKPTSESAITDIQEALSKGKGIIAMLNNEYYNLYQYSLSKVDEPPIIVFTCGTGNKNKQISYMENNWEITEIETVEATDWEGNHDSLSLKATEYANNAYKATKDVNGNNITTTYATIRNVKTLSDRTTDLENDVEDLEGNIEILEGNIKTLSSGIDGLQQDLTEHINTIGTDTAKGHLKLSDSYNSESDINDGIAATPKAVKTAYDALNKDKAPAHEFGTTIPEKLSYGTLFIQI